MTDKTVYQEELMDHYRYPRGKKKLENPDFISENFNLSCGDTVRIEGSIFTDKNGVQIIKDLGFSGSGCVISQATASMLMQKCVGKNVEDVLALSTNDILNMIGLELGPVRLKCALISLQAIQNGLLNLKSK